MKELATAPVSLFWYWMNERHRIYLKRTAGEPKPWTDDPILRDFKFTNVYRQLDRGTVWLTENFIQPHWYDDPRLLVGNIAWYRQFNWWGTGEALGWQTEWRPEEIRTALHTEAMEGRQVFTNAHIIWSEEGMSKIDAVVDYATSVWNDRGAIVELCKGDSLEAVFERLQTHRGVGGFIAYEIVTDLRHTLLLKDATDIMTWANPGPGAIRGLRRLGLPHKPRQEAIRSIEKLLRASREGRRHAWERSGPDEKFKPIEQGPAVLEPHMPVLEMRDVEHSLCEFDKYCRVKFNEGEPRMRFNGR